ncbi:sensor histidine kinase [Limnothrix sp. PR1529]|uniref:sensor histidine kinase n=1 Tax=Limnothrix sp. PR1529 TaxID=1704291 RepID=UPI00081F61CA|nr:ATP-binding protein [Limnothrix sp. PR1529]OCQ95807.1 hypothetical protein BCR12_16665 [Limnothrix sp. P13C2]
MDPISKFLIVKKLPSSATRWPERFWRLFHLRQAPAPSTSEPIDRWSHGPTQATEWLTVTPAHLPFQNTHLNTHLNTTPLTPSCLIMPVAARRTDRPGSAPPPPPAPSLTSVPYRRYGPVAIALLVGVGLSAWAANWAADRDLAQARAQLQQQTQQLGNNLRDDLEQITRTTRAGALMFDRRRPASAAEFQSISQNLLSDVANTADTAWIQADPQTGPYVQFQLGQGIQSLGGRQSGQRATIPPALNSWLKRAQSFQRPLTMIVSNPDPRLLTVQGTDQGWFVTQTEITRSLHLTRGQTGVLDLDIFLFDRPVDYLQSQLANPSSFDRILPIASTAPWTVGAQQALRCPWKGPWDICTQSINVGDREMSLLVLPHQIFSPFLFPNSIAAFLVGLSLTASIAAYLFNNIRRVVVQESLLNQVIYSNQQLQESRLALQDRTEDLETALQELQEAQAHLIQSEKLSSLGQLVAGIAHEINNPVSFVHGNLHHASEYATELLEAVIAYQERIDHHNQQYSQTPHFVPIAHPETLDLDYIADDFPKLLTSMRVGTNRIREIVKSLRIYSHVTTEAKEPASLHESIDRVLMILSHRIQELKPDLNIIRQNGSLPAIDCTIGQIDQVLINLLVNAIDAIEERWQTAPPAQELPTLTITTQTLNLSWIKIEITDNGIGMNEVTRAKLFDPFYTTKPVGKGTGLGMAIAYQIIVERHYGSIDCRSIPHHGTTFEIKLPITRDIASAATSA